jgi:uncharacterized iron-regulated protein
MMWFDIVAILLSLATLGDYQRTKKDTMSNIADVTSSLAALKATVDKLVASQKATTEATIAAALEGVVSNITSIEGEVAALIPASAPTPIVPVVPTA